jgi:hypothetical protein
MKVGFFYLRKTFFQKRRFCDQNIASATDPVDIFNKMGTQQTFGSVSVNCISYFFTRDKSHFFFVTAFIKEYKIGSMPGFCRLFVYRIERSTRFQASKLFYTANLFLPLDLLAAITFLPFFVFIRALKPCVLFLGVLCG